MGVIFANANMERRDVLKKHAAHANTTERYMRPEQRFLIKTVAIPVHAKMVNDHAQGIRVIRAITEASTTTPEKPLPQPMDAILVIVHTAGRNARPKHVTRACTTEKPMKVEPILKRLMVVILAAVTMDTWSAPMITALLANTTDIIVLLERRTSVSTDVTNARANTARPSVVITTAMDACTMITGMAPVRALLALMDAILAIAEMVRYRVRRASVMAVSTITFCTIQGHLFPPRITATRVTAMTETSHVRRMLAPDARITMCITSPAIVIRLEMIVTRANAGTDYPRARQKCAATVYMRVASIIPGRHSQKGMVATSVAVMMV